MSAVPKAGNPTTNSFRDHTPKDAIGDRITAGLAVVERPAIAPRYLRLKDAAEYIGLGTKMLRQLISSKELPFIQLGPNSPFIVDRIDLDRFMERKKINGQT